MVNTFSSLSVCLHLSNNLFAFDLVFSLVSVRLTQLLSAPHIDVSLARDNVIGMVFSLANNLTACCKALWPENYLDLLKIFDLIYLDIQLES